MADVPVGCLLSGGVDSSLIVGLLAEAGQTRSGDVLDRLRVGRRRRRRRVQYSDIIAERFGTDHHQIRIGTDRMLPALDGAIGAMSEPMVSHDCVAFYLLSQEVAKHVKVVQSGQGADEVFAGYHWYPPMGEPDAASVDGSVASYRKAFFDRDTRGRRARCVADRLPRRRTTRADGSSREHFAARRRRRPPSTARCASTPTVMLVDDPVKRVDNMTMAWGLEAPGAVPRPRAGRAGRHLPAGAQDRRRRQGRAQGGRAQGHPAEVIDRPKGYFPVPALTYLEGPYLDMVRDALYAPAAKERGLFRPEAVDRLLADPNGQLTPLRGNELWQIALLELWLQTHGITGAAA